MTEDGRGERPVTSPFDRTQPTEAQIGAWQPLVEGVATLGVVVGALRDVVEHLANLVEALRELVANRRV